MTVYPDISELDEPAHRIRVTWNKTVNFANTFSVEFNRLEELFNTGRYGPEWTFSRWLITKCGMSRSTSYRVIIQLNRVASDELRDQAKRAIEEEQKKKSQQKADQIAVKNAWNEWLDEEKLRIRDTQKAWDEWKKSEKQRVIDTQKAWDEWKKEEQIIVERKANKRAVDRARYERKKSEKENEIKLLTIPPDSITENEKSVSEVRQPEVDMFQLETTLNALVTLLSQLTQTERLVWIQRLLDRLIPEQDVVFKAKVDPKEEPYKRINLS